MICIVSASGYICTFLPLLGSQAKDAEGGASRLGDKATPLGPICPNPDLTQSQFETLGKEVNLEPDCSSSSKASYSA